MHFFFLYAHSLLLYQPKSFCVHRLWVFVFKAHKLCCELGAWKIKLQLFTGSKCVM